MYGTSRRLKRGRNGMPSSASIRLQDRSRLSRDERPPRCGAHDRIATPSSSFEDRLRDIKACAQRERKRAEGAFSQDSSDSVCGARKSVWRLLLFRPPTRCGTRANETEKYTAIFRRRKVFKRHIRITLPFQLSFSRRGKEGGWCERVLRAARADCPLVVNRCSEIRDTTT